MAKKKYKSKIKTRTSLLAAFDESVKGGEKLYNECPELHGVIHKSNWDFISKVNVMTRSDLDEVWVDNLKENIKGKVYKKHKMLVDDCMGLGKNKAVIGIGSGPSFNKNKGVLSYYLNMDGIRDWKQRNYITICANHQFKPMLEMGIIPDFVLLVDASDVVYKQLCEGIPSHGKSTILITGLHCSPRVLNEWSDQGRHIRFVLNPSPANAEMFEKLTGKNAKRYIMEMGGNVLNGAWSISITKFLSNVFVAVGNDLSYELCDNLDDQRSGYYSDKDYSTNAKDTGTGRDEAARTKRWAGFTLTRKAIYISNKDRYNIKLDLVGTSHTLWVYKNWLESTLMRQLKHPVSFHYFNCTEGGILGVMSKCGDAMDISQMRDKNNWYMFDDVCKFYHTAMLADVLPYFEKCVEVFRKCNTGGLIDAQDAEDMARIGSEGIVRLAVQ